MRTSELDYELPDRLIARTPPEQRDGGRLLVLDRPRGGALTATNVRDLPRWIPSGALLVLNNTRVIPARLFGRKPSGGRTEVLLLKPRDESATRWHALARASNHVRAGTPVTVGTDFTIHIAERNADGTFEVTLLCDNPWAAIERYGEMPLPPYMGRRAGPDDRERYQTVFAQRTGAVAAPTAGLHFSEALLRALTDHGIERTELTLHVGAGTFAPISSDDLDHHAMHAEYYEIPATTAEAVQHALETRRPIAAVGTTVVRALESWGGDASRRSGDTRLLIQPGYSFRVVQHLFTNFHLPRSTLLALVMAFAGVDEIRRAYAEAIAREFRFYSYGDAMLIL